MIPGRQIAAQHSPADSSQCSFWSRVATRLPSLKGAASTAYYFDCERWLFEQFLPPLPGRSILKTDLWDEAKNTEILRWAAEQGARPFGIDVAIETVGDARRVLAVHSPGLAVGDVRALPFRDGSFDLVYSMGTVEHFPEYRLAVREMHRVLKPGGRAIIGVPNKADPFLRPLLVHALNTLDLYPYGAEKSFFPSELRRLVESVGFAVHAVSGILFMPGWLRMLDLAIAARVPRLAPVTALPVAGFACLYRRFPRLRRHGYLLACVATKPDQPATAAANGRAAEPDISQSTAVRLAPGALDGRAAST